MYLISKVGTGLLRGCVVECNWDVFLLDAKFVGNRYSFINCLKMLLRNSKYTQYNRFCYCKTRWSRSLQRTDEETWIRWLNRLKCKEDSSCKWNLYLDTDFTIRLLRYGSKTTRAGSFTMCNSEVTWLWCCSDVSPWRKICSCCDKKINNCYELRGMRNRAGLDCGVRQVPRRNASWRNQAGVYRPSPTLPLPTHSIRRKI